MVSYLFVNDSMYVHVITDAQQGHKTFLITEIRDLSPEEVVLGFDLGYTYYNEGDLIAKAYQLNANIVKYDDVTINPVFIPDLYGKFNGSTSLVKWDNIVSYAEHNTFRLEVSCRLASNPDYKLPYDMIMVATDAADNVPNNFLFCFCDTSSSGVARINFTQRYNGVNMIRVYGNITFDNNWHDLVFEYTNNASGMQAALYCDGVEIGTDSDGVNHDLSEIDPAIIIGSNNVVHFLGDINAVKLTINDVVYIHVPDPSTGINLTGSNADSVVDVEQGKKYN